MVLFCIVKTVIVAIEKYDRLCAKSIPGSLCYRARRANEKVVLQVGSYCPPNVLASVRYTEFVTLQQAYGVRFGDCPKRARNPA
jgi:hypothetical protein